MNQEKVLNVLLSPHVSEKSAMAADSAAQHTFRVTIDATKPEIKKAVETLFGVKVKAVQVINTKGKEKRFGQIMGRRKDWKKAVVRLHEGHDIDFAGAEG